MEQRPLRLGDLVDDYCPRERRITNHVVVALVEDEIRQTRCSTCDAEHTYKSAREPKRRRKDAASAVYHEVLASVAGSQLVAPRAVTDDPDGAVPEARTLPASEQAPPPRAGEMTAAPAESPADGAPDTRADEGWLAQRQLIRATLPRVEGEQPPPRPIPEFTMHQRQGRGGQGFRHGRGQAWGANGGGNGNGVRQGRPHGRGPGQGHPGSGQGDGQQRGRRGKNRRGR